MKTDASGIISLQATDLTRGVDGIVANNKAFRNRQTVAQATRIKDSSDRVSKLWRRYGVCDGIHGVMLASRTAGRYRQREVEIIWYRRST